MASGDTLAIFTAFANQPPASGFATIDTRNAIAVLDFDAGATETAIFVGVMPKQYAAGGVTVAVVWMATTATSGNVVWSTSFERMNTDLDADSFATGNNGTGAANATSGILTTTTIAHTDGAQIDGLLVSEPFRLRVQRLGADGSDTMTGDAELVAVHLYET